MFCPNCANNIKDNSQFCGKCGKNVASLLLIQDESPQDESKMTAPHENMCEACGKPSRVKYVAFYENKGFLIMRHYKEIKGNLCKECIDKYFWKFTLTTLFVGWIGTISLLIAPIYIINNVFRYAGTKISK